MQIRITKQRGAVAALLVLAGVGLGSLLSPLVGSALATVGQVVNISDRSSSAYFVKVDSSGALKTTAAVSGRVAPALPPQPFAVSTIFDHAGGRLNPVGPTTATVALTDVTFANHFGNQARRFWLDQFSAPAPNANCVAQRERQIAVYDVGRAQTVQASFETPVVLKPLASGDAWCLNAVLEVPSGDVDRPVVLAVNGYVVSGSYAPSVAEPTEAER